MSKHATRSKCLELITEAADGLTEGGSFFIVVYIHSVLKLSLIILQGLYHWRRPFYQHNTYHIFCWELKASWGRRNFKNVFSFIKSAKCRAATFRTDCCHCFPHSVSFHSLGFLKLTSHVKHFPNLFDLIHVSIWDRAHWKHLEAFWKVYHADQTDFFYRGLAS